MLYKATVSFSGKVSMSMGEVREISDQALADDLTKAGYIMPVEADKPQKAKAEPKPKATRKGKKTNEN